MRILMSTDVIGGVFTYTAELARALERAGDEVAVATLGGSPRPDQRARLPGRVYESSFALEWMPSADREVEASAVWLAELESELRPDVVHLCSFAHGAAPLRAPRVVIGHSCVCSWWSAVHGMPAPAEWDAYRRRTRVGIDGADAMVAPTRAMLAALEREHGPCGGIVIPNGSPIAARPARERWPFVLGAGRLWDAAKNLAALDAVADSLAWPVVLAGDLGGGPPPRYARHAGSLAADRLAALRRCAAIFAAPARYEPFGLAVLEAALDGCALVLGRIPSLVEVWGDSAVYVDPDDLDELRAVLGGLIADDEHRRALARSARQTALRYGIDRCARGYRRLYQRLASARAEAA